MAANLDQLQAAIDAHQAEYVSAAERLREVLPQNIDAAALLARLDEFGVDESLAALKTNPQDFALGDPIDSVTLTKLAQPLQCLSDCTEALDEAVLARETLLAQQDPSRQRRVMIDGQEYTVDGATDTLRSVEAPETTHSITPGPLQHSRSAERARSKLRDREH